MKASLMNTSKLILLLTLFATAVNLKAQFELQQAFPNLSFTRPVDLQNAGDQSNRIFVVEQAGIIHVFPNDSLVSQTKIFLDIVSRVDDSGNEMGLLGLAFHPDYASNGYFYVNYTAGSPRRTVISRFQVSASNPDSADPESEFILLQYNQPQSNHNGGQIAFGPDGFLYIASGDGGGSGDQHGTIGNGQDRGNLLGKILRIDVDNQDSGLNYAIPRDNPFYGNTFGYSEEIYAYGLRNPWRFSFDFDTGWLWAADVGQSAYEEIDLIENGKNYGWRIMEGNHCYNPPTGCDTTGLSLPVWEYAHGLGYSVTGGYVYRGAAVPELTGKYIYGDYVTRRIWALSYDGINPPVNEDVLTAPNDISSFGQDENMELYICTFNGSNSKIFRFKPTVTSTIRGVQDPITETFHLGENYPNPFNPGTQIPFSIGQSVLVQISIYDISGKLVRKLIDNHLSPGNYTVLWDGRDASGRLQSSGVFIYRLMVNDRIIQSRRLTLLK